MTRNLRRAAIVALLTLALVACSSAAQPGPNQQVSATVAPVPTAAGQPTSAAPVNGAPATATPVAAPINPDYLEFGIVAHLYYTDRARVMQLVQNAGFEPVTVLALGYLGDPEALPEDLRVKETSPRTRKPL
ncbi:MAG: hypothetical protein SNJ69_05825, partial [Chloroflexaceae bacterium]